MGNGSIKVPDEILEPEDIFKTSEFKALPWKRRFLLRLKIAFFQTISMY